MEKKILILYNSVDHFKSFICDYEGVVVDSVYKKKGLLVSVFKKIFLKLNLFHKAWHGTWVNTLSDYSTIIVFANCDYTSLRWIKNNYPHIKIVYWYWNPTFRLGAPKKIVSELAEMWSFDRKDCEKYNMKYNSTFYFSKIQLPSDKEEYDVSFLGIDKGRRKELEEQKQKFEHLGIQAYFHIVPDKNELDKYKERPIGYKDYLSLVAKSKGILDIKPINQDGLTLRPMEALFFKKKLITTDSTIVKEPFYNRNNIFIIGRDDELTLKNFLSSPYIEIEESVVLYYDFGNWLKRIMNE